LDWINDKEFSNNQIQKKHLFIEWIFFNWWDVLICCMHIMLQKQLDLTFKKDNNKKVEKMRITDSIVEYPYF